MTSSHAAEVVIAAASASDFVVAATGPTQYRLSRTYRPGWVVPTAIVGALVFGLGLLLLILVPKRNETCLATVNDGRRGVTVRLSGVLPRDMVEQIRVGLGRGSTPPVGAPLVTVAVPLLPAASPPPGEAWYSPGNPSAAPASAPSGSTFASWGPVVDPLPASPTPVDATATRATSHPTGQFVGTAIRIGSDRIPVSSGVVVGRNPAPVDALPGARLVAIGDSGLSKTHLAIRSAGSTVEVCDLSSTNGTVVEAGSVRRQCVPGVWLAVDAGSTVVAGDQRMEIGS